GAGHDTYTDRFHKLARLVPHLVTPEGKRIKRYMYGLALQIRGMVAATEPKTIQKAVQIAGTLTNEALRNGSIKKNPEKRGNRGEPSKDRNGRDDNKRTMTGNAFATTTNPVRRENTGVVPKCTTCNTHHPPEAPCRACFNCNHPGHFAKDCRVVPRGRRNQGNQARGRAFVLGVEEARQDPNIMTGTFTLNDHFATTLFDSGAGYSFVSTTFIPLLDIEPNELGFSYEIEIASGQLVEIDKVIKGFKLEIDGHVFNINLIPFGSGSFDVIIRMDWLSDHKAEIICLEKVVRIPLLDGKVLRVLGEKPKEKIVLVPRAIPVEKSPYRLSPSELEELFGQLKEL
ncbi:putative reverse transcriptase domain-containing protein, partial [Tanacetum coccineum]